MIEKIRNWLTTEGPGHTDYPRKDIAAHRSNAKLIRWIGYIGAMLLITSYIMGPQAEPLSLILALFTVLGVSQFVDISFRVQALEWEVELQKEE